MHMTSGQAALVAQQAKAKNLLLTHFSQRYPDSRVFRREAREIFPAAQSARDLARYPFTRPEDAVREERQESVDDKVDENPDAAITVRGAEDVAKAVEKDKVS